MTSREAPTILVAPTAFKGTLGPMSVANAVAEGVRRALPRAHIVIRPLSDGGTGLLEALRAVEGGIVEEVRVTGPLGEQRRAHILWVGSTAVVESAEACGIHLVPPQKRDPLLTTTRGVGELLSATEGRARELVLGLGGSGTVDGGAGMARALGWSFTDAEGQPLPEGGGALIDLARIAPPSAPWTTPVTALCDVSNPLLGPDGAARVYAPQKGADPERVERLEAALGRFDRVIKADLGAQVAELPGAGAAGGLGAGARTFLGAELVSGAEWVIGRAGLGEVIEGADVVITGEGRFDVQSRMGKLAGKIIEAALSSRVPVLLICGRIEGPLPPGVQGVAGSGGTVGRADLVQLAELACRALAAEGRL